ncbi:MAG: glutamine-hydrolyzing GMP synthase [Acidobacteriota bacterium]|nr:glutamine-hydrolyzing GMP synthase [Acidobacteriota bacterium]
MRESILILDFGGQYTQLIARRIRESGVYSEILPFSTSIKTIREHNPRGIVLSGGPQSVFSEDAPHPDPEIYDFPAPILGICYGMQLLAHQFGGKVIPSADREYGRAQIETISSVPLFESLPQELEVWMSHGDRIDTLPDEFTRVAQSDTSLAAMASLNRKVYGVQFHPEVAHTPKGQKILENFLFKICECCGDWSMASFTESTVTQIASQVGSDKAVCGLSGGVDSTVAAILVHKAIGDRLTCIFVDNGLLRKDEFEDVLNTFQNNLDLHVIGINASHSFLEQLAGVEDPEKKRKIIGKEFIRVFEVEAQKLGQTKFLVQGTLYPDIIESTSVKGPSAMIKSHHNVGGLPEKMSLALVEPLRELFKDEVREVGRELKIPEEFISRQPFPGPGLAVRIIGEITPARLEILREADHIVEQEIRAANFYTKIWQSFAILLPVKSVGVMGDNRTYENVIAIRAVHSLDGMTADWVPLPYDLLAHISNRIVNEVHGVNRVVYDISSKPPSTIEWE